MGPNTDRGKEALDRYHQTLQAVAKKPTNLSWIYTVLDLKDAFFLLPLAMVPEFLRAVGYCRLCIPGFVEIAKPLYISTGGKKEALTWTETEHKAFKMLKQVLVSTPALTLTDLSKPFQLHIAET
ncbi:uncharacterized protein LOC143646868 [Tamandua tetradactyla]|uniref:uncharacterized protein LOC143646868 n=1 Tax=Tamandua tetradactyla TaxID=48850 RepID=UPI004053A334